MTRRRSGIFTILAGVLAMAPAQQAGALAQAHRSVGFLPFSNGRVAAAYDVRARKLDRFWEHPYRQRSTGPETRNFLYDLYPGLRVGSHPTWLSELEPEEVGYVPGTGVVRVQRSFQGVRVEEHYFAPMGLDQNAVFLIVRLTRMTGADPVDVYSLFNFHLGAGAPSPSAGGEQIARDATRGVFYEWGPAEVTFAHASIGAPTHWAASPQNPWSLLNAGQDLPDNDGTGGAVDDAVCGFQSRVGSLPQGYTSTLGWFSVLAADKDAAPKVDAIRTWIGGRDPAVLLSDELAAWEAWTTDPPAGASPAEAALHLQSQAILRMSQVSEPGRSDGQILASLPPGKWNITWVRDMAYSVVALVRTGHLAEAKRALAFQLGAQGSLYQSYVGMPYRISVCRYFGDGVEESDWNGFGPNIEFDGFGLFLWTLDEYVRASNDTAALGAWWPDVKALVADVLVGLQEPSGLVRPDSSIWEVHWEGKQKRFSYTTITAANGLCAAARLAELTGDTASAAKYRQAGAKMRDALARYVRSPEGILAQAPESLAAGAAWLDASAVEAFNFGLFDPAGPSALATLQSMRQRLVPPSGRGFKRNETGEWYDSQEWIFVDFRAGHAHRRAGLTEVADALLAWNVEQANVNFGEISELHDSVKADYAGEAPMAGFGAGAYLLALHDRAALPAACCEAYADESLSPPDGGYPLPPDAGPDAGPVDAGSADAGGPEDPDRRDDGCGCAGTGLAALALAPVAVARRRKRA